MFNKAVIFGISICLMFSKSLWAFEVPASWEMAEKGQNKSLGPAMITLPLIDREALTRYYDQQDLDFVTKKTRRALAQNKVMSSRTKAARPYRFAEAYKQSFNLHQSGAWDVQGDTSIWRLSFDAANALGLNIGFKDVSLPKGARLYVYDQTHQLVLGPYTHQNNKPHGQLWTPVIKAQTITIELNVATAEKLSARLTVASVNQSFRELKAKPGGAKAGNCNINVVCPAAAGWEDEVRSVARYTVSGTGLCSGTMVNNTSDDLAPYFLSADHCGVTLATAPSLVFYWNYEATLCGFQTGDGAGGGTLTAANSGATFIAASAGLGEFETGSDFVLVLMDDVPSWTYQVYWAGWDHTDSNAQSVVGIHHPNGDEKSISFDADRLDITDYLATTVDSSTKYLRVLAWDSGTTEPGSSGSGLWSNPNQHLVGTLSGGNAACRAPPNDTEDNDESDWYGRIASHWTGNGTDETSLRHWLDLRNVGSTSLNGRDSCDTPRTAFSDPGTVAVGDLVNFSANVATGGSGSGYQYAWDFNADGVVDSTDREPSYTYTVPLVAQVSVVVRDGAGCPFRTTQQIVVSDTAETFVANNTIPVAFTENAAADGDWTGSYLTSAEGNSSARAAAISHLQYSDLVLVEDFDAGIVSYSKKVSTEAGYDCLAFFVDNELRGMWSGESDWSAESTFVTAGPHTLVWRYIKDVDTSSAADAVWVDSVTYTASGNGTAGVTPTIPVKDVDICGATPVIVLPPEPSEPPEPPLVIVSEPSSAGLLGVPLFILCAMYYLSRRKQIQLEKK